MAESRRRNRTRTLLGARVVKSGWSTLDCNIRDLTDLGAKLSVEPHDYLPDAFDLDIPHKSLSYKAVVRWREGPSVGVEFVVAAAAADPANLGEQIKRLEAENKALRLRIADMAKRLDSYGDAERSAI